MAGRIYTYDVISDASFNYLANAFAGALRAVAPLGSIAVEWKGQTLYHPFQIAVNGPPGSGKSSFIRNAVEGFFAEPNEHAKRTAPSSDEERQVLVWSRWVASGFEIRSEDHMAQQSLARERNIFLPEIKMPGISFYEHADDETRAACPMALCIYYDRENDNRYMAIQASEQVAALPGFEQDFLIPARTLQIN